jgi:hypothetical protein
VKCVSESKGGKKTGKKVVYIDRRVKLVNNPDYDYDYSNPSKRARNYLRDDN